MKEILDFAQTASPVAVLIFVIIILVIAIFRLVVDKPLLQGVFTTTKKVSTVQDEKYPQIEQLAKLIGQNEILLNNHFKHEIPDMLHAISRIEKGQTELQTEQRNQGERLARIEGQFEFIRSNK